MKPAKTAQNKLTADRSTNGSASEIRSTRLMLDLCERVTPIPFEAAVQMGTGIG
jgi:hypothetical protein